MEIFQYLLLMLHLVWYFQTIPSSALKVKRTEKLEQKIFSRMRKCK